MKKSIMKICHSFDNDFFICAGEEKEIMDLLKYIVLINSKLNKDTNGNIILPISDIREILEDICSIKMLDNNISYDKSIDILTLNITSNIAELQAIDTNKKIYEYVDSQHKNYTKLRKWYNV